MTTTAETGRMGEKAVADYLRARGYLIMEMNWRSGRDEIDIIACGEGYVAFVEVKTRSLAGWTPPETALTSVKRRAFARAVNAYISLHDIAGDIRLDFAAVDIFPDGRNEVRYVENAFESHW